MNTLMKQIDLGELPPNDVMNILSGGLDLEDELFPKNEYTEWLEAKDSLEPNEVLTDRGIELTEEDAVSGAVLRSEND